MSKSTITPRPSSPRRKPRSHTTARHGGTPAAPPPEPPEPPADPRAGLTARALGLFDKLVDPTNNWAVQPDAVAGTADIVLCELSLGDRTVARRVLAAVLGGADESDLRDMVAGLEEDHANMLEAAERHARIDAERSAAAAKPAAAQLDALTETGRRLLAVDPDSFGKLLAAGEAFVAAYEKPDSAAVQPLAEREPFSGADPLGDWTRLGVELAARPHRLQLALHVAMANACGGAGVSSEEEERLAAWFGGIVGQAIERTGGAKPSRFGAAGGTDNPAASAIWFLLGSGDWIAHHDVCRPPRCPSMDEVHCPGDPGFVDQLCAAAPGYLRTVIAGASPEEVEELRVLVDADGTELDAYRPFATPFTEDAPAAEDIERAVASLSIWRPTREQVCATVERWAVAFQSQCVENWIPPVHRIGAVVWLVKVALADADGGAS